MDCFLGFDLGSTTTKAIMINEKGTVLGRGITNSRSDYDRAAEVAKTEAIITARFNLLRFEVEKVAGIELLDSLLESFRLEQLLMQLERLEELINLEINNKVVKKLRPEALESITEIFIKIRKDEKERFQSGIRKQRSDFFRDIAGAAYFRLAEELSMQGGASFELLLSLYDKSIILVENEPLELGFHRHISTALDRIGNPELVRQGIDAAASVPLNVIDSVGTGYGRVRLPFPKENIRSEILCHGLGAHSMFPNTRTVLDIGGQDTKAIQVNDIGVVTRFQMNDRCAAGCGRYLGYIADEMNIGLHELGPMASKSTRPVRINSTCTVFAGAELRDRLALGEKREDILAGLHRAVILRAMSLLSRTGGVENEFTFTGGVAKNEAATNVLKSLIEENYGHLTINISPSSIYTGALGAAIFAMRGRQ